MEPIMETVTREVTDVSRGIISGVRVPAKQLRSMAAAARKEAERYEDIAADYRRRAELYEDVATAREKGEL